MYCRLTQLVVLLAFSLSCYGAADFKWWATTSPNATSGTITLKNASGAARTIASNPTGAYLSTRTANTQAPTVIVQATQSLPVKNIGDTCTQVTSGTSPNQIASEGTAVTSDRAFLLKCNLSTGVWLPEHVYAMASDACNIIYKATTFALADKLTLTAQLPSGTLAHDNTGLILSCQSGVWRKGLGSPKILSPDFATSFCPGTTNAVVAPRIGGYGPSYISTMLRVDAACDLYKNIGFGWAFIGNIALGSISRTSSYGAPCADTIIDTYSLTTTGISLVSSGPSCGTGQVLLPWAT